jgi:hypothetical protein
LILVLNKRNMPTTAVPLTLNPVGAVADIVGGTAIGLPDQTGVTSIPSFTAITGSAVITITPTFNGCVGVAQTTTITVGFTVTETHVNNTVNGGSAGSIDISVSGGTAPYTYLWNTGQTTQDRTGLAQGAYTVTVTDANSCVVSKTIVITQPNSVAPAFTVCPSTLAVLFRTYFSSLAASCTANPSYATTVTGSPFPTQSFVLAGATTGSGVGNGSGSVLNQGTTTVTITATNILGSATCIFDLIVVPGAGC